MKDSALKYVIGLDFGTDSVRALLVNAFTGEEINHAVCFYSRWARGLYCNPPESQYRQHPLDYLESMEESIRSMLSKTPKEIIEKIIGLSIDTTGSTPVAIDERGTPLALLPEFAENPNAMFVLWKDHTATEEADKINELAHRWKTDYTKYSGGIYSPEWFWSKILHITKVDKIISKNAYSWAEHCDWMPAVLTGNEEPSTWKRSRCAAGHKAMWHKDFGGLPSEEFLQELDYGLTGLRAKLFTETYTSDQSAGKISQEWANRLGLPLGVKIGVGALDAHFGAVGSDIEPFSLVKVMGTSTCDMLIAPNEKYKNAFIGGICGQVDGSIIPEMLGMEAGQSAFGDVYNWFREMLEFPLQEILSQTMTLEEIDKISDGILPALSKQAAKLPVSDNDIIALDWINGRRTPNADLTLKGAIYGLHLGSGAPHLFKALVEATAFGSKAIVEQFIKEGVPINNVIALGGIAKKSAFVMQTLANVLNMPIAVVKSEQACALGAAMFAATVAGVYSGVGDAQKAMSSGFDIIYQPEHDKVIIYQKLYERYCQLGIASKN